MLAILMVKLIWVVNMSMSLHLERTSDKNGYAITFEEI